MHGPGLVDRPDVHLQALSVGTLDAATGDDSQGAGYRGHLQRDCRRLYHPGGEVRPESAAHDAHWWATEGEWRSMPTWYTKRDLDALWAAVRELDA